MPKPVRRGGDNTGDGETTPSAPTSFPNTLPPSSGVDIGPWMLQAVSRLENAIGRLEGTVSGGESRMQRIEAKLDAVHLEVTGHGKWLFAMKVMGGFLLSLLGWVLIYAVWPFIKKKLGIP